MNDAPHTKLFEGMPAITPAIGLGQWLTQRAERNPARPAITFEGNTWTYGALLDKTDRLAAMLQANGIGVGDRVGFLGFNHPMFFAALFATAKLGAIFVPLNFRLTGTELEFIINDAGVHTLIVGPDHWGVIDEVRPSLRCQQYLAIEKASDGWPSVETALTLYEAGITAQPAHPHDTAVIMYTSGTTGRPKGAMLTHGNFWWNHVNELITMDVSANDVLLTFAPVYHIGALNVLTLTTLLKGGHMVLHRHFDPGLILQDIPRHKVSTLFTVPAMLLFISQHGDFATADLSSVRMVSCGGAPCPEPLLRLFGERGVAVQQGYGLTETAALATTLTPEWALAKLGSVGKPPLLTQIRIVDGQGDVATAAHARGEICVRGMNITKGYWNQAQASRDAIDDDGWFRTGDIGYLDEDGFLYVCDRVKDMIISGGENVYPAEVESIMYEHPAVAEAAVIGRPDDKWGERVAAVVALKAGTRLTLEELQGFIGSKLARYKMPRELHILDALPRNPTGKLLKYRLRESLEQASALKHPGETKP